jgi:hypothetical protein
MRPTSTTLGQAGPSSWIPLNRYQSPFNVALSVTLSSGASLTYKLQHTFDDPQETYACSITRSSTTATVTLTDHGLVANDSVTVIGAGAPLDGTYTVASVVDANSFTYTVTNSGATVSAAGAKLAKHRVFDHEGMTGKTANEDGNYAFPVAAVRLNVTAYTGGKATLTIHQGGF